MTDYYILSLKWTRHNDDSLTWWGPDCSGYTTRLEDAGRYSEEAVRRNPGYYDNRDSTAAIRCEVVDKFAARVVLQATSRALLIEALGSSVALVGTVVDDKDYEGRDEGRDECPHCGREYGRPGSSRLVVGPPLSEGAGS